jgi:Protein of unknown function (DUF3313).
MKLACIVLSAAFAVMSASLSFSQNAATAADAEGLVGEMTLAAELRDSPSGALLARIIDREQDPESCELNSMPRTMWGRTGPDPVGLTM